MYWVDKHLIFTYYQKDKEFDEFLPKNVINFMSIAVAIHLLFGIFLFSNQNILNSQSQDAFKYGYNAQYLNNFWIAQNHIILYIIMSIVFVIIIIFEKYVKILSGQLNKFCEIKLLKLKAKIKKEEYKEIK